MYKSVNEDVEKYRYQNNYSMAQKTLEEYFNLAFPTVRTGGVIYNGHTGYGREYSGEFEGKKIKIGSDSGDLLLDNNISNLITPSYNTTERLPYGGITRMFDRKMAFRCLEEYGSYLQEFVTVTGDEDVIYVDENGKEYSASSITYQLEMVYSDGVLKVEPKYLKYILDSFDEVARVSEQNKKAYEKPKKSKKAAAM